MHRFPVALSLLLLPAGMSAQNSSADYTEPYQLEALDIYRSIIGYRSAATHGRVPEVAAYLADRFQAGGFPEEDVQVLPFQVPGGEETAGLIVRYRGDGSSGERPILLLAHMDVVDALPQDWERDPFTLIEEDGYFFGRGSFDDKFGITMLTTTFLRLKAEGFVPTRDLVIAFTGDEETGMMSARRMVTTHRELTDAEFALNARAGLREGETVLVHGAAGGVGTATIQVAKGMGATVIAVCSTQEKGDYAKAAGADEAVLLDGFKDSVMALTAGRGVDVVVDVVGGSVFTDSLRCLATLGRLLVVGFAAGEGIPEVKVNRLLLNNIDVRGVGWGGYGMMRPGYLHQQWEALLPMIEAGAVKPPIGATYSFDELGRALVDMDERRTLGKSVVRVR